VNGEIQQASNLVISARRSLYENKEIDFTPGKHVQSIQFVFAPRLFRKQITTGSVHDWFNICLRRGLKDIKFVLPSNREEKHLLGFANTSQCAIICFWEKGRISGFYPTWEFDAEKTGWTIRCLEQRMGRHTVLGNLRFADRTDEFKRILLDIEKFAKQIKQPYFSDIFHAAYTSLCDGGPIDDANIPPQLPFDLKAIYFAVDKADVFGAMGSWNDSPSWYAEEKGLEKEYNELSNQLLVQLRYHLMYVVNECWNRN
jgi:hypothetical protein